MHVTRKLRKNQTPWELKLWNTLRDRNITGLKFRRQFKIGHYVADFCCVSKKFIIELDGGHHNDTLNAAADLERQKHLESLGYKVLRFWNTDIDHNLDGVIQSIIQNP